MLEKAPGEAVQRWSAGGSAALPLPPRGITLGFNGNILFVFIVLKFFGIHEREIMVQCLK